MVFRRRDRRPDSPQPNREITEKKLRPKRNGPAFQFSYKLLVALLVYWVVIIHYFERVRVKNAIEACQWNNWEHWEGEKADVKPHRIAILADPQLVDDHTYPSIPRIANYILRRLSDNYLFINHKYMQAYLDPDTTIFLGDLFDGGRDWDDDVWFEEYRRFNKIFPHKTNRRTYRGLPGNHDIGFQNISYYNLKRFSAFFGESNDYFELGNHTFVQLDTISYSNEDPEIHQDSRNFLENIDSKIDPTMPRILLTHVPLYRDPGVESCGPGRESKKNFPLMRGFQYQTVIDYVFTQPILASLEPVLVFSGDDHDVCDMTHVDYNDNTKKLAREISCKTPSMTNGIKYPAIHLLSLNNPYDLKPKSNPNEKKTYETMMCYLPNPYRSVKFYAFSWLVSIAVLLTCIVYPEKLEQFVDRSARSQILPHAFQISMVDPEKVQNTKKRLVEFFINVGTFWGCVLFLFSLYNSM